MGEIIIRNFGPSLIYGIKAHQGTQRAVCPKCSHSRKPQHRKERCLSVTFKADSVQIFEVTTAASRGGRSMTITLEQWLESRNLDIELAAKMGWVQIRHDDLGPSVKIPYVRDGKTVTVQYRALEKKAFRFATGSAIELWNVDCLKDLSLDSNPLVIAEGACDGLALMQCGFPRVVAVPGWSDKNFDPANYEPFTRNEAAIKHAGKIIVAQHTDNAGASMLRAIANFFDECEVRYVSWPPIARTRTTCFCATDRRSSLGRSPALARSTRLVV